MYDGHTVAVVVPAYNEAPFIGDVIAEIPAFVDTIYAVDDASTDGTWEAVRDAASERAADGPTVTSPTDGDAPSQRDGDSPQVSPDGGQAVTLPDDRVESVTSTGDVVCLRHEQNRGAGGAIKTGYLAAIEDEMDVIATIDGDGQMDSSTLSGLLDPIVAGAAGYAKGNRFSDGEILREMPPFRLFGNVVLTALTRVSTGYWRLMDPQNGFTAASREALVDADVGTVWEYYGYMNQLMARLNVAGVTVADVPMDTEYGDEESSIDYTQYIRKVSGLLATNLVTRLRRKGGVGAAATVVCYVFAVVCLLGGALKALGAGRSDRDDGTAITAGATAVSGALAGALVDSISDPIVLRWEEGE